MTQQVHWLDFNKGILLLEMHGTNIKKKYNHIYSDTKWNQKNMKECDKRNSHTSSKLHLIYIHFIH
jgi:hypothetical protein